MFSGIIEFKSDIRNLDLSNRTLKLTVSRPKKFDDLKLGDSIAVDGVCLTIEKLNEDEIQFSVGEETLNITNWNNRLSIGTELNLERSLKLGDRIHGHLVSGHVDNLGIVSSIEQDSEFSNLKIRVPKENLKYLWKKGSLTVNGVSLTINDRTEDIVTFGLIGETIKRTNLSNIKPGDFVNIECDYLVKGLTQSREDAK